LRARLAATNGAAFALDGGIPAFFQAAVSGASQVACTSGAYRASDANPHVMLERESAFSRAGAGVPIDRPRKVRGTLKNDGHRREPLSSISAGHGHNVAQQRRSEMRVENVRNVEVVGSALTA
jgi:hypothetical protein